MVACAGRDRLDRRRRPIDYAFGRAGLGPANLCCSLQVAPGSAPVVGIGDPNLLDTEPDMIGGGGSFWSGGFALALQNGTTIAAQSGLTLFSESSLTPFEEAAPVPEPASVALVGLGVAALAVQARRRNRRR